MMLLDGSGNFYQHFDTGLPIVGIRIAMWIPQGFPSKSGAIQQQPTDVTTIADVHQDIDKGRLKPF